MTPKTFLDTLPQPVSLTAFSELVVKTQAPYLVLSQNGVFALKDALAASGRPVAMVNLRRFFSLKGDRQVSQQLIHARNTLPPGGIVLVTGMDALLCAPTCSKYQDRSHAMQYVLQTFISQHTPEHLVVLSGSFGTYLSKTVRTQLPGRALDYGITPEAMAPHLSNMTVEQRVAASTQQNLMGAGLTYDLITKLHQNHPLVVLAPTPLPFWLGIPV